MRLIRLFPLVVLTLLAGSPADAQIADAEVAAASRTLVFGEADDVAAALAVLEAHGKPDVAAAMILAMRFNGRDRDRISAVLQRITGHDAGRWFDWMLWQQRNPEIEPHPTFADLKLELLSVVDPEFLRFLGPNAGGLGDLKIRLEEITWGGVAVDGIPALDYPDLVAAAEADYLRDDDLVFGVEINGDARAYPLRIMGWHEMFNDTVGGVHVALAYCTLCGSGILYETQVEGLSAPLVFGSSGLLYRSNKLMFDRQTDSLWNQFTGRPVSGPLRDSGLELKIRPVAIASWGDWRDRHPMGRVLSLDTGHVRDYGSGVVYQDYFAGPDLMFPALVDETALGQKDYVFGIRTFGAAKAWPVAAFGAGRVVNDQIADKAVVLIGNALTRTVRAYERGDITFAAGASADQLTGSGGVWRLTEAALEGPDGTRLARVPGHVAYWFAWDGYLGTESELADIGE